ncbi:MAG: hypothetical protein J6K55_09610 [Clostridia bacterium]|nr:hypothetical protein [Clostridia bacterium]
MQKYRPKSVAANIADHVLRLAFSCAAGIAWFIWLWGLRLTSLTAGIALGGLFWLCVRQFGLMSTRKKELQMRRIIGGELALKKLLLLSPRQAGFQTALWIAPRFPIVISQAIDWGVVGTLNEKQTLVRVIAQHESQPVTVQQVVEIVREACQMKIERCLLCLTAPASKEAADYARQSEVSIHIVSRDEMIHLAGFSSPATDEQLIQLRKSKKVRRSRTEWLQIMLEPGRARRYFWFGIGLSILALLTGQSYYPLPAALCLLLYVLCRIHASALRFRTGVGKGDPFQNG